VMIAGENKVAVHGVKKSNDPDSRIITARNYKLDDQSSILMLKLNQLMMIN
jgi:hypothetical protein